MQGIKWLKRSDYMRRNNWFLYGFTLIELVIVIVVLGILSAVAFSKYVNMQSQARTAKAMAIFGSIREASSLAKAACALDLAGVSTAPTCTTTGGTVNMDGTTVTMVNQYPDASSTGILAATQLNTQADQVTVTPGNPITFDIVGGTVPDCRISYTASAAVGTAPTITLVTTGC
jgi:MSHA pilin protein MshA